MSTAPALVNPALLIWAREEAGYALNEASKRTKIPLNKLVALEKGEKQPSMRQAGLLAKLYERSLGLFALPTPPKVAPLATEYRHLPGVTPGKEPPLLRSAIRRIVQRRRIALHLMDELGDGLPVFSLKVHLKDDPEKAGASIRKALDVPIETQFAWPNEFTAYRAWRSAIEHMGVLVCQFPGKEIEHVRGIGVIHFPLPAIGVNSKEIPLAKPFTLLHELVHLTLAASHEEHAAQSENRNSKGWEKIERFCEAVASAVLMPLAAIQSEFEKLKEFQNQHGNVATMRRISRKFKVTPTAVATRLFWAGLISPQSYGEWKGAWEIHQASQPKRPSFGIATPPEKAVNRAGSLFTSLVLSALQTERITSVDASYYLDLSFDHIETLRKGRRESPAESI